jgi:hypothetical protein
MKLYTEEQVRRLLKYLTLSSPSVDGYIERLTPIELPSDEEIIDNAPDDTLPLVEFIAGAKWMRDKILNQNK